MLLETALVSTIFQTFTFWFLARISSAKTIDRKKIREMDTSTIEFAEMLIYNKPNSEYPIRKLFTNGLRSILTNTTIVLYVIAILFNGLMSTVLYSVIPVDPIKEAKNCRLSTIDSTLYAVVYQMEDKYFLEEANITQRTINGKNEYSLRVYTDRQRVVSTDDICFSVYNLESIVKEHKQETPMK